MGNKHKKTRTGKQGSTTGFMRRTWKRSTFGGGPGTGSGLVVAWSIITVFIICTAWALWPATTPGTVTARRPQSSAPHTPAVSTAPDACPAGPESDTPAEAPPADLSWAAAYGSWPVSATAGPTTIVDGIHRCFAHSQLGAALAAVNIIQGVRVNGLDVAAAMVNAQFEPGPGQQAVLAGITASYPANPPESRSWGRVIGFKVVAYTPDEARIVSVESWPQAAQYLGETITVVWDGGDWKVQPEPDGKTNAAGTITVDPGSFILWGGGQ